MKQDKNFRVYVTRDFEQMSQTAANIAIGKIADFVPFGEKPFFNLILPTGKSPTGMYKIIQDRQDCFDASVVVSHNLDEYVGLPGTTITDRLMHPEGYAFFMIQQLFSGLKTPFHEWHVPRGCEIEQGKLEQVLKEYRENPTAYNFEGVVDEKQGLAIAIPNNSESDYLNWIKKEILDSYIASIKRNGKVDLAVVGVGGRGHIAFHESGIPLNLEMLLVKLDENTIENSVKDRHFASKEQSPKYAVSVGAGFVYNPDYNSEILLLANGKRKTEPIGEALLGRVTDMVPISGCQEFAKYGKVIWVIDEIAAGNILGKESVLKEKGIQVTDLRSK